jgi:hypothetical protein
LATDKRASGAHGTFPVLRSAGTFPLLRAAGTFPLGSRVQTLVPMHSPAESYNSLRVPLP